MKNGYNIEVKELEGIFEWKKSEEEMENIGHMK